MRLAKLITFSALIFLNGCASQQTSFAPTNAPAKTAALPSSVAADQFSWDVTRSDGDRFRLTQKVQIASAGTETPPQPQPTEAQVKQAAEQALPPGCKIEEIKTSNGESQVKFSC